MNNFEKRIKVDISQEEQRQAMLDYMDKLAQESYERSLAKGKINKKNKRNREREENLR